MSIKLLKRLSCGIISGVCCCLFCLLLATAANADVCFLPTGQCEAASANLSAGCSGFNLTSAKDETGWNCTQCGEKWKCEKKSCKDDYQTGVRCTSTETKVCDETRKSGDESCCKCEDSETKCQHEGYAYKKTKVNICQNKCPYNSDYYESCKCPADYDKETNTDKCSDFATCEVGDLADSKKFKVIEDLHNCRKYENNEQYVTQDSEIYKGGKYDCVLVCSVECTKTLYYSCSPKKDCKASEGKYETEELCRASLQHASVFDIFKKYIPNFDYTPSFNLISTSYAATLDHEACWYCKTDPNPSECYKACMPQTQVDGPSTNLCPIDLVNNCVTCIGSCNRQGYPCCVINNTITGCISMAMEHDQNCVYCKTDDPTYRAPGCEGYPCCDITPTIPCRIDPDKNCALCSNGCDRKEYPCCLNNPEIVDPDPNVTESPCELKDGCWVVKETDPSENGPCNATNYPYVKASSGGATSFGGVNWDDNTIIRYLNSLGSIYAAHTDHFEGDFDTEIFNKIADDANECTDENGVKRYDKICSGRPESKCVVSETRKFTPNGCTSSTYIAHYNGRRYYKPSGTTWGECETVCSSLGSQYYNSYAECLAQTGKAECFSDKGCWRSCESAGYYSTEADCSGGKADACVKQGSCYVRNTFYVRYKSGQTRTQHWHNCSNYGGASGTASWWAFLGEGNNIAIPKDINGIQNGDVTDSKREFKAGTYYLCVGISDTCSGGRNWGIRRTQIVGYLPDANGEPTYGYTPGGSYCFADTISGNSYATGCDQTEKYGPSYSCHSYELKPGFIYEVSATADW